MGKSDSIKMRWNTNTEELNFWHIRNAYYEQVSTISQPSFRSWLIFFLFIKFLMVNYINKF